MQGHQRDDALGGVGHRIGVRHQGELLQHGAEDLARRESSIGSGYVGSVQPGGVQVGSTG